MEKKLQKKIEQTTIDHSIRYSTIASNTYTNKITQIIIIIISTCIYFSITTTKKNYNAWTLCMRSGVKIKINFCQYLLLNLALKLYGNVLLMFIC